MRICTFFLIAFFCIHKNATCQEGVFNQSVRSYFMMASADTVLQTFVKKYRFVAIYDRNKFRHIYSTFDFTGENLSSALQRIAKSCKETVSLIGDTATFKAQKGEMLVSDYDGPATAFNIIVNGTIKDAETDETMPFVSISLLDRSMGTVSNVDGYFSFFNIPCDTSTLVVSAIGYSTRYFKLSPKMNLQTLNILVKPKDQLLGTVEIVGEREDLMQVSGDQISTIKMSPKKIQNLPNIGEKDMMRSFQLMPGVSAANESSSGLYVRGGTPDQNLILYDGFTVYHVDHLYGFFSAFNSNAIKDIQLYKGGFDSRFGGRLSSVTEITAKEGNGNRVSGGLEASLLSLNGYLEGPLGKKMSFIVAARRSYKGFLYKRIFNTFNNEEEEETSQGPANMPNAVNTVTSYFYDLNGKITLKPSDKDIYTLSFYNGTDKLDNGTKIDGSGFPGGGADINISINDLTKYGNIGSSLKWSHKWNERLYGNTLLSYSNYYSDRDQANEGSFKNNEGKTTSIKFGTIEENNLQDLSLKSDYTYSFSNSNSLDFGMNNTYFDIAYTYAQNDTSTILDRRTNGWLNSIYVNERIKLFNEKIILQPGLRLSYFSETSKSYLEPRLQAQFRIMDKLTLKAASGKYYQYANRITREDILSGSRDFWLLSNDQSVPVSAAVHYIGGLSFETRNLLFSTEVFRKDYTGLTEYSLRFEGSPQGIDYKERFYNGKGYSQGIEFLIQKKSGKWNGWVSYTLGESKNKFDIYGENEFYASQDVTNEFKIINLYNYKRWDFSATWIYATGKPYTSPIGGYTVTLLDGSTQDYFSVTDKNGNRLPDYHRLDFSANFKIKSLDGKERGYVGLSLFNVYGRKNSWYKKYTIADNTIIESNVNYLGFTPNLTLALKF